MNLRMLVSTLVLTTTISTINCMEENKKIIQIPKQQYLSILLPNQDHIVLAPIKQRSRTHKLLVADINKGTIIKKLPFYPTLKIARSQNGNIIASSYNYKNNNKTIIIDKKNELKINNVVQGACRAIAFRPGGDNKVCATVNDIYPCSNCGANGLPETLLWLRFGKHWTKNINVKRLKIQKKYINPDSNPIAFSNSGKLLAHYYLPLKCLFIYNTNERDLTELGDSAKFPSYYDHYYSGLRSITSYAKKKSYLEIDPAELDESNKFYFDIGDKNYPHKIVFAPNDEEINIVTEGKEPGLFQVNLKDNKVTPLLALLDKKYSVKTISDDLKYFVTQTKNDKTSLFVHLTENLAKLHTLKWHNLGKYLINNIIMSNNNKYVAATSHTKQIYSDRPSKYQSERKVWNVKSGKEVSSNSIRGHDYDNMLFSLDSTKLITIYPQEEATEVHITELENK